MDWINSKYREVNFIESTNENEYIVIAKVGNEMAGLGRLVKIDSFNVELGGIYVFPNFRGLGVADTIVRNLCDAATVDNCIVWCLPFENLLNFYSKFGFKICEKTKAPEKITNKLNWCNSENTYGEKVILLCRNDKSFS